MMSEMIIKCKTGLSAHLTGDYKADHDCIYCSTVFLQKNLVVHKDGGLPVEVDTRRKLLISA